MSKLRAFLPVVLLFLSVLGLVSTAQAHDIAGSHAAPHPATIGNCSVFPSDNPWNRDVSRDPVDPNSDMYIATLNSGNSQNLNFGFGLWPEYGIPYNVVPGTQPLVPVDFQAYANQSDPGPYPIPPDALVEGLGVVYGDKHVVVVDQDNCKLYELFNAAYLGPGWTADSGAIFDLRSDALRPDGWTSADSAGLPIFPGLVRRDEVLTGAITHALRFTVGSGQTQKAYRFPARHYHSSNTNPARVPMGTRIRLKASFDISGYSGSARIILQALKTYGMFVADEGSMSWNLSGMSDPNWDRTSLETLKTVTGSAFEVVLPPYPMITPTLTLTPTKTLTPTPVPSGLKVQYYPGDTIANDNQIKARLSIVNTSSTSIPLSELTMRYYFTRDTAQPLAFTCQYATLGCANYSGSFTALSSPTSTADYYLEVSFGSGAGSLAPNSNSGELWARINKTNWSTFDETNDYSYDPTRTTYTDWSKVTQYRNGVLVWGTPPNGIPTAIPTNTPVPPTNTPTRTNTPIPVTLKLQYKAGNPVLSTQQLGPYFNIVNTGSSTVLLNELTIRYYFTRDSASSVGMAFYCDYSPVGCANITGTFVPLSSSTATADVYVEVSFTSAAGSLAPGAQTGDIQLRINKTDWSLFDQSNDYSFDATKTAFADWTRATLYRNGVLIWGIGPTTLSVPTATPSTTTGVCASTALILAQSEQLITGARSPGFHSCLLSSRSAIPTVSP